MSSAKGPPRTSEEVRAAILARYEGLSKRLQQIARYVLDEPNAVALETLAVIGERAGAQLAARLHRPGVIRDALLALGDVLASDLRRKAITRTYNAALAGAGLPAVVQRVVEDKKRGLVAQLHKSGAVEDPAITAVLGGFITPWEWDKPA